ncbi:MAG: Stk1 family PASTA domain-containing Ser/Thr kinase [Jatrophihabitantaceae bacterium]
MQTAPGDRRDRIIGRVLEGRYRVLERVARGGMSTVYSALDERLDRPVAVKVMSAALSADPAFADRFAREARIAARLAHLNAVSVYDQGTDGEHVFLVMELVKGRTLRDLLRERGVLTPAQAVSIMEPVLGALAAAHRAGLVHRDVKPENILLSDDGAVKVADFGLARAIEADASSTRTGLMMGTVAYCPPEQISRGSADARSDVYSAGVMLFELLTGSAPYLGDSAMAVAYQHVNSDVPPPSSRRPGIPAQLDEIVLRATSREPSGRPLDAGAMLAELHDARVDLGLPVVGVPPRHRSPDLDDTQQIARVPRAEHPSIPPVAARGPRAEAPTAPTHGAVRGQPNQHTAIQHRTTAAHAAAEPATSSRAGRRPPTRQQRARRRTLLVMLIILLLGLLTGYGAWYLAVGRYHQVPNVSGQAESAAIQQLRSDGFQINPVVDRAYSESAPTGLVVGTHPAAGAHLLGGRSVQLVISKGAERYLIPQVNGKSYDQAQQAFAGMPIQLNRKDVADPTGKVAAGSVIRTDPAADAQVRRNAVVNVYVSAGPPPVTVPDVKNKSQNDAQSQLSQAGLSTSLGQDYSSTVPDGSVISQDPPANATVPKFSTVRLVISQGPPVVTLPQIPNGTNADDARSTLEALHLKVRIKKAFGGFLNKVVGMDPKAGQQVPAGSEVVLTVV